MAFSSSNYLPLKAQNHKIGALLTLLGSGLATAATPNFDAQLALSHIATQVDFGPRVAGSEAKQKTLNYLQQQLSSHADSLQVQSFTIGDLQGHNLWASFHGIDNATRITLAAHWDTRPISEQDADPEKRNLPGDGANDGASGVGVLLAMARLLDHHRPPVAVDLLLFDLEDMGDIDGLPFALGSSHFVQANPEYHSDAGVLLDMVCDRNLRIPKERYSQHYAGELLQSLWAIARSNNATAFIHQPGGWVKDDHLPFLRKGIAMVDLIHFPFPDYWHTSHDTMDNCSVQSLQQVGDTVTNFIYNQRQ